MPVFLKHDLVFPHCVCKGEAKIQGEHFVSLNLSTSKNIKYEHPPGDAESSVRIIFLFPFYDINQTEEIHGLFPFAVGLQKFLCKMHFRKKFTEIIFWTFFFPHSFKRTRNNHSNELITLITSLIITFFQEQGSFSFLYWRTANQITEIIVLKAPCSPFEYNYFKYLGRKTKTQSEEELITLLTWLLLSFIYSQFWNGPSEVIIPCIPPVKDASKPYRQMGSLLVVLLHHLSFIFFLSFSFIIPCSVHCGLLLPRRIKTHIVFQFSFFSSFFQFLKDNTLCQKHTSLNLEHVFGIVAYLQKPVSILKMWAEILQAV